MRYFQYERCQPCYVYVLDSQYFYCEVAELTGWLHIGFSSCKVFSDKLWIDPLEHHHIRLQAIRRWKYSHRCIHSWVISRVVMFLMFLMIVRRSMHGMSAIYRNRWTPCQRKCYRYTQALGADHWQHGRHRWRYQKLGKSLFATASQIISHRCQTGYLW